MASSNISIDAIQSRYQQDMVIYNVGNHSNQSGIIVAGISGSGKSTFINELYSLRFLPIQPDNYRKLHPKINHFISALGRENAYSKTSWFSHNFALGLLDKALQSKTSVIYETTFNRLETAQSLIDKFIDHGYQLTIVTLPVDVKLSISRSAGRFEAKRYDESTIPRQVPRDVIEDMSINFAKNLIVLQNKYESLGVVFMTIETEQEKQKYVEKIKKSLIN
ncbi:MAG: AAA family ATPase [Bacteroidales bacterium]|nr:AAA family ATPase [Bacteroidales bacterium]